MATDGAYNESVNRQNSGLMFASSFPTHIVVEQLGAPFTGATKLSTRSTESGSPFMIQEYAQ